MLHFNISNVLDNLFHYINNMSYVSLGMLMALESTCFPILIPVETVIIPMGYLIFLGHKNLVMTLLVCVIGVAIGSFINYWMARIMGRPLVYKYSKFLMIKSKTLEKWEKRFIKNGKMIIFFGRFIPIPAVKHIITIPAGIAKMNILDFLFFNTLGAIVFSSSMLSLGYFFGQKIYTIKKYIKFISWISIVALVFIIITIFIRNRFIIAKRLQKAKELKNKLLDKRKNKKKFQQKYNDN